MAARLLKRPTAGNLQVHDDVEKRQAFYDGKPLVSTGKYVDMMCSSSETKAAAACLHRFYLVHGAPFDVVLGSDIPRDKGGFAGKLDR